MSANLQRQTFGQRRVYRMSVDKRRLAGTHDDAPRSRPRVSGHIGGAKTPVRLFRHHRSEGDALLGTLNAHKKFGGHWSAHAHIRIPELVRAIDHACDLLIGQRFLNIRLTGAQEAHRNKPHQPHWDKSNHAVRLAKERAPPGTYRWQMGDGQWLMANG